MNSETKEIIQYCICIICVIGAMVMSFLAMYITPAGEIHESILWLIAQVLVFCGSLVGITAINTGHKKDINKKIDEINERKKN